MNHKLMLPMNHRMNPIKESIRFYARHIEALLLLSALIVFPFLLLHNVTINYLNLITTLTGAKVVSSFFNLFLLLLFFTVMQLPFAQYVQAVQDGEEKPVRMALRTFAEYGFSMFLFGIVYALAVSMGVLLFVLPGLLVMCFYCLTPQLVVMKQRSPWKCWRGAVQLAKKQFVRIVGLLFLACVAEWGIGLLAMYTVTSITSSYGAIFFTQLLLNVIVFPFIAVVFAIYTQEWSSELGTAEAVEEYAL